MHLPIPRKTKSKHFQHRNDVNIFSNRLNRVTFYISTLCNTPCLAMQKCLFCTAKGPLLHCKTAVFASYLDHIDVEIVYKIGRKALVLPCKQAVFVAQYYPIRAQWLAFQRLKVAHKKSENLQKLLL